MTKDIYKFVGDFPELQKIMNTEETTGQSITTGNCIGNEKSVPQSFNSTIKEICEKADNYISIIQRDYYNKFNESRCIYFYYWLYHKVGVHKNINETKDVYKFMISQFNTDYGEQCMNYKDIIITEEEMLNLKVLYDMHVNLNNKSGITKTCNKICECAKECADLYMKQKDKCKSNTFPYFCNVIEEFRKKYNDKMSSSNCDTNTPSSLPSLQSNNVITLTLIPIVVTLAISSLLSMLYKFTTYGRHIRYQFMRKRNKYNNIDKGRNITQQSEICRFNLKNNSYLIL
ncbi:variable surface protein [Plasmodium gonderi]|uniref:Variable surface protein n=1 Tax=Plasmodium gonderi TaxID=77519 RepID=A0A1Y1JQ48_PLAGO|nr:variable surface protein [Plasmodium gonderi]GAW84611.1 variable surface protein [Plasmodium gonderi]